MSENKFCYSCRFYRPYYTKGNIKFDRLDYGRCNREKVTVDKHESCDEFSNMYYGRINRKQAALAALTDNIHALAEIKQILEEDDK